MLLRNPFQKIIIGYPANLRRKNQTIVGDIVYTAGDNEDYLWNGSGFDLLENKHNEKLLFSGRSYTDEDLPRELQKAREAVKLSFPTDTTIRLKQVEVPVNSKSDSPGHTSHIIS